MIDSARMRAAAATIVEDVADRLRDPAEVARRTLANHDRLGLRADADPAWHPQSLSRGYAGVALLHAELGLDDAQWRRITHRYLLNVAEALTTSRGTGMFSGVGALAAIARAGAYRDTDYARVLAQTDARLTAQAQSLIAQQQAAIRDSHATTSLILDVLSGLAGLGRYFLHRSVTCQQILLDVLGCLAQLAQDIHWRGSTVPAWWYSMDTTLAYEHRYRHGEAAFGLAHGVPGPLALLSIAWRHGVRVQGQQEAIERMTEWLLAWRFFDDYGAYWPARIPLSRYLDRGGEPDPAPGRASWCWGTYGIARAIQLSGHAMGKSRWTAASLDSVYAALRRPRVQWQVYDVAVCHGWSGLLHLLCRISWDDPDPVLRAAADTAAATVLAEYRPDYTFGFRYRHHKRDLYLDFPGLLEGAAGIALALYGYSMDRAPASEWDSLLLLG